MEMPSEPKFDDTRDYRADCIVYLGQCVLYLADEIFNAIERLK